MHPSDDADAVLSGIGFEAELGDGVGGGEYRFKFDLDWNTWGEVEGLGDSLGVGGDLLEGFWAVEVLTAGHEPEFEGVEVGHLLPCGR